MQLKKIFSFLKQIRQVKEDKSYSLRPKLSVALAHFQPIKKNNKCTV